VGEPLPVFERSDKGLDYLGVDVIAIKLIELVEPEVITAQRIVIAPIVGGRLVTITTTDSLAPSCIVVAINL